MSSAGSTEVQPEASRDTARAKSRGGVGGYGGVTVGRVLKVLLPGLGHAVGAAGGRASHEAAAVDQGVPGRHQEIARVAALDGRLAVEGGQSKGSEERRDFVGGIRESVAQPAIVPVERSGQVQEQVAGALADAAVRWHQRGQPDQGGQRVGGFEDVRGLLVAKPVGEAPLLDGDEGAEVVAGRHRAEPGLRPDQSMGLVDGVGEALPVEGI